MSKKYIELKEENIIFEGKTEEEKKINKIIYELCLENDRLEQENEELKNKLENNTKIYLNTSKYAFEMEGRYVESNYILTEFEKWLNLEIKRYNELIYPKQGIKPYGEELHLLESYRSSYMYCLKQLQEFKGDK